MRNIPFTKPLLPTPEKHQQQLGIIWKNHQLTNHGQLSQNLWKALARQTEQKYFLLTSSGTMALIIAIKTLGLTGEIITTPFAFPAVPHAISFCGLKPIFCDVDLITGNITPEAIKKAITSKTSGILAVHTFGNPCAIKEIQDLAQKHKLKVIYDAAPAFNVAYQNKNIIHYGDASIHSYHATKIFHTVEGGAVFFRNKKYMLIAEQLREFGFNHDKSKIMRIGFNAKMSEFHAAMGLCVLPLVSEEIHKRAKAWQQYDKALASIKQISRPQPTQNYQTYTIRIPKLRNKNRRNTIYKHLLKNNIHTKKYYALLATQYPHYATPTLPKLNNAQLLSEEMLSLPLYGDLTEKQIQHIIAKLKGCFS